MSKATEVLNGKVFISIERIVMALGVAAVLGVSGWDLATTVNTKTQMAEGLAKNRGAINELSSTIKIGILPRIELLEKDVRFLNQDWLSNPRHSADDDAKARSEDRDNMNRRLNAFHERLERHEDRPHP